MNMLWYLLVLKILTKAIVYMLNIYITVSVFVLVAKCEKMAKLKMFLKKKQSKPINKMIWQLRKYIITRCTKYTLNFNKIDNFFLRFHNLFTQIKALILFMFIAFSHMTVVNVELCANFSNMWKLQNYSNLASNSHFWGEIYWPRKRGNIVLALKQEAGEKNVRQEELSKNIVCSFYTINTKNLIFVCIVIHVISCLC